MRLLWQTSDKCQPEATVNLVQKVEQLLGKCRVLPIDLIRRSLKDIKKRLWIYQEPRGDRDQSDATDAYDEIDQAKKQLKGAHFFWTSISLITIQFGATWTLTTFLLFLYKWETSLLSWRSMLV